MSRYTEDIAIAEGTPTPEHLCAYSLHTFCSCPIHIEDNIFFIHRFLLPKIIMNERINTNWDATKILEEPEGEYHFTRSADDNYHAANHIYNHADGKIIATAFHENTSTYGERDLARAFKYGGSLFTRITCQEVCDAESEKKAREP